MNGCIFLTFFYLQVIALLWGINPLLTQEIKQWRMFIDVFEHISLYNEFSPIGKSFFQICGC